MAETGPRSWWYTPANPTETTEPGANGAPGPSRATQGGSDARAATAPSQTAATPATGGLPSISLPKGGGAIRGIDEKLSVNQATGTASLSVGVFTSPARQDFGPSLALSYDSGAGNGPFGLGWNLGAPAITRKTSKGLPRYQDAVDSDVFMLSGAEDLVPVVDQNGAAPPTAQRLVGAQTFDVRAYRPRVEAGFTRIERWTDTTSGDVHWRTISTGNVTSLYGQTPASRIADPANSSRVFSWLLDLSFDDRGNAISYVYKREDCLNVPSTGSEDHRVVTANRYLKRILYGNDTPYVPGSDRFSTLPTDWCFQLVLDYGEHDPTTPTPAEETTWGCRPDPFSTYRSGFEIRTYRLCRRLLMFHQMDELGAAPVLVRSTDLTYQHAPTDPTVPVISLLASITQTGWITTAGGGSTAPLPPLTLDYASLAIDDTLHTLSGPEAENIVGVFDGTGQRWVDLDGEGLQGILTKDDGAWYYQHNVSAWNPDPNGGATAKFDPIAVVATKPSRDAATLTDLNGTGQLCAVDFTQPAPGWFQYDPDVGWSPLRLLSTTANVDFADPNLRFVDLDGDGLSDVLITEDNVITWYQWQVEQGFVPADRVPKPFDEEQGPAVVLADATQSIHLADMTGDGLTDLVRVRNGEICYWPNLGYGRFGAKVSMDNAPLFDNPDLFTQRHIAFADIDGSGTADIAYLGARPRIWFNQSGNSWTAGHELTGFPITTAGAQASMFDLLGTGTACAVWTSPLPDDAVAPLRYVDLTAGIKPYLLTTITNNLGAQRTLTYAPSTKFYLQDRAAGHPWITRLPFPVHVVEKTRTDDAISRTSYTCRYSYHHGFYDGVEREFRGFARVDTYDTDALTVIAGTGTFTEPPQPDPDTGEFDLPTVHTRTWFHTGAYFDWTDIAAHLQAECWNGDPQAPQLAGTQLPDEATPEELREACRALRGHPLRQEVYALDGSDQAANPYSTVEYRYQVNQLQPPIDTAYGSYHPWEREALSCHYERNTADPRIGHDLTLTIDDYGNITSKASVGYQRRNPNPALPQQSTLRVSYAQADYTNKDQEQDWYRIGVPVETRGYELTGVQPDPQTTLFDPDTLANTAAAATDIPYQATPTGGVQRRLLTRQRTYYRADNLAPAPLAKGDVQSLALVWATYTQRYTMGLLSSVFGTKFTGTLQNSLLTDGKYVDLDNDGKNLWQPSSRLCYSSADPTAPDATYAQGHFYQPVAAIDPFGNRSTVTYDNHNLLVTQTRSPAIHTPAAGIPGNTILAQHNYRVLGPWLTTDPNLNRSGVRYDALGQVTATAIMGKLVNGTDEGDHLDTTTPEASPSDDPTTTLNYDLFAYVTSIHDPNHPAFVHTTARVTHKDPNTERLETYTYTDGLGRIALTKAQAEPGPAPQRDTSGVLVRDDAGNLALAPAAQRWVGTGKVVYDNKGNPVKAYEPFFDTTSDYTDEADLVQTGVTAITRYDPLGRVIRVDNPNGTYRSIEFDPWQTITSDENDTVLTSAWYAARSGLPPDDPEAIAANKAAQHAKTPTISNADTLGRVFQTIANNGPAAADQYATTLTLDIQGRTLATQDALLRTVLTQDYDMTGAEIHHHSVDAGDRWLLTDAGGQLLQAWDSRNNTVTATYDELRRPTTLSVDDGTTTTRTFERMVYGETLDTPATPDAAETANLRGALYKHYDDAGLATTMLRDFKNNTLTASRQLFTDYNGAEVNWPSSQSDLDPDQNNILIVSNTYDALSRITTSTAPDGSLSTPLYNERSLLASVTVNIPVTKLSTTVVTAATYNAKGQRETITYGNGAAATNTYDPDTFRLTHITTNRPAGNDAVSSQIFKTPTGVQDIQYTYDPVGNITQTTDTALTTFIYNNHIAAPTSTYVYDPIYRLISATGREHVVSPGTPPQPTWNDLARIKLQPNDIHAMQPYTQTYDYDPVGNFKTVAHLAPSPPTPGQPPSSGNWTRTYTYDNGNNANNQLTLTSVGATSEPYTYDAAGNMYMPHLFSKMQWDFKDQLQVTAQQVTSGTPPTTYYRYDSAGQRVIKATYGQLNTKVAQRVYLGGYELYREYDTLGNVTLERRSLHVGDGGSVMCLLESMTTDTSQASTIPNTLARYQFGNNLGSTAVELDNTAALISYEEYYPYGSTSLQTGPKQAEVSLKRYRYTGRERDTQTGFTYHGARYYAPWIARWTSCDPAPPRTETSAYAYAGGSPMRFADPDGRAPAEPEKQLYFSESEGMRFDAIATGRRYWSPAQRAYSEWSVEIWGGPEEWDIGHPKNAPHVSLNRGDRYRAGPEQQHANRSGGTQVRQGVQTGTVTKGSAASGPKGRITQPKPPPTKGIAPKPIAVKPPPVEEVPFSGPPPLDTPPPAVKTTPPGAPPPVEEVPFSGPPPLDTPPPVVKTTPPAAPTSPASAPHPADVAPAAAPVPHAPDVAAPSPVPHPPDAAPHPPSAAGAAGALKAVGLATEVASSVFAAYFVERDLREGKWGSALWDFGQGIPVIGLFFSGTSANKQLWEMDNERRRKIGETYGYDSAAFMWSGRYVGR